MRKRVTKKPCAVPSVRWRVPDKTKQCKPEGEQQPTTRANSCPGAHGETLRSLSGFRMLRQLPLCGCNVRRRISCGDCEMGPEAGSHYEE